MIDDADSIDGIDFDTLYNEHEKHRLELSRGKAILSKMKAKLRKQTPHKRTASPVDVSDQSKRLETLLSGTPCDTF